MTQVIGYQELKNCPECGSDNLEKYSHYENLRVRSNGLIDTRFYNKGNYGYFIKCNICRFSIASYKHMHDACDKWNEIDINNYKKIQLNLIKYMESYNEKRIE